MKTNTEKLAKKIAKFIECGGGQDSEANHPYVYTEDLNDFGIDGKINLLALAEHISHDGAIRFEHAGYIISVSDKLPDWDAHKVAYFKTGDEDSAAMRCPKNTHGASVAKLIAKSVAAIDRRRKTED